MTHHYEGSICEGTPGQRTCSLSYTKHAYHRRVEILAFIDPLCAECWGLEPLMKKFFAEYHDYFTIRFLLTTKHGINKCCKNQAKTIAEEWNKYAKLTGMCCNSDVWYENPPSPYSIALAIKAAEFQGQQCGHRFLRRIREQLFLRKNGLNNFDDLLEVAQMAGLNSEEFKDDFQSSRPIKSLKCDRKLVREFAVSELPSLVFSTANNDEDAIKISGHYDYSVYVQLLTELLGDTPEAKPIPVLQDYFKEQTFLTTKEVCVVYNWSEEEALIELRKLQLQQIIEPVTIKKGTFWKYNA